MGTYVSPARSLGFHRLRAGLHPVPEAQRQAVEAQVKLCTVLERQVFETDVFFFLIHSLLLTV